MVANLRTVLSITAAAAASVFKRKFSPLLKIVSVVCVSGNGTTVGRDGGDWKLLW